MANRDAMDGLVTVLVEKICTGGEVPKHSLDEYLNPEEAKSDHAQILATQRRSQREAQRVYDALAALDHEGKIRALQQFGDAAHDVDEAIANAWRDRDAKTVGALWQAFGSQLGKGPTTGVIAWSLRFQAHAQNMVQGACNDKHVADGQEMIRLVGRAIVLEVVKLRRQAPGRAPDTWHPDVLAQAEKALEAGEAGEA